MIKRFLVRAALIFICPSIWIPLLLMAGNALMSEGKMLQRFGATFGMGNAPVKAIFLPEYPTLRPLVELLIDSPGFYVMFWSSCFQTGMVLLRQLVIALLGAWGFACFQFKEKKVLSLLYIILMMQPFQVATVPNYLVLKRFHLLNAYLAVILPGTFSAFPVFAVTKFFESIPRPLLGAARLGGAGEMIIFMKIGIPMGKPGIVSILVLGFLGTWNAIEQPMTFLKEKRLWPLSLYLPGITSDKTGVAWAASIIMMVLPVVLFMTGQESLEQEIAVSGIKERMNMKKAAITFLTLMAALTSLFRALDFVMVTRVQVGYGKQGAAPYLIEGDGTFTADKMAYISFPENLQVGDIPEHSGQMVLKGEAILCLQMKSSEKERKKLSVEFEKARLALEQERLSSVPVSRLTKEALAAQSVATAQRALELGRQDLAEIEKKHAPATVDLEHDYIQKKNRTRGEVREDNRRAMKGAGRAHESARIARDSAVRKGEREVEDKQKKPDRLEEQEDVSQQEIGKAALELKRAEEDPENIRDEQDLAVEEARAKIYAAEETYENIDYRTEDVKEELHKAYEDAMKAEDAKVEEARRKIQDLEEGLYQSMEKLENARVSDVGTAAGEAAQREISRLRQESMKLDMEQIKRKLEKVEELIADKGQIGSNVEGIVADIDLKAGDRIESRRQIKLAVGNLNLASRVDKEKTGLLKPGAKMTVRLLGQQAGVETEITFVDQMPEDETVQVTAAMPQGQGSPGGSAPFAINMESGAYSCVVPTGALKEDNTGFFCLAAQPKGTILGEEMMVVRIGLEVLEESSTAAAVSDAVAPEMKLIAESGKSVGEGDRVRVVES